MDAQQEAKGLVGTVFDFSFTSFVTTKIIKFLYGLGLVASVFLALTVLGAGLATREVTGILGGVILAPVALVLGVLYTRVLLEVLIVLFRICEHTGEMARNTRPSR